jgi:prepilin signal peptidase PulO-like enzyme (type II secretory pathway)
MSIGIGIVVAIIGAIVGSFVGVVAERAYTGQSWKKGRSRCNSCRELLTARDLVPVFSWILHKGRCRMCSAKVPGAYALYELSMGLVFYLAYQSYGLTVSFVLFIAAVTVLAFITIYDLRHTIVPPAAVTVFILVSALFAFSVSPTFYGFIFVVLHALGIAFVFFLLYLLSRGRAMGLGDTPAVFGLSLLAGRAAMAGVLFSFWVGGVIGIFILALRKGGPKMGIEVPFVPFMAVGFLLALFTQWNPLPF